MHTLHFPLPKGGLRELISVGNANYQRPASVLCLILSKQSICSFGAAKGSDIPSTLSLKFFSHSALCVFPNGYRHKELPYKASYWVLHDVALYDRCLVCFLNLWLLFIMQVISNFTWKNGRKKRRRVSGLIHFALRCFNLHKKWDFPLTLRRRRVLYPTW